MKTMHYCGKCSKSQFFDPEKERWHKCPGCGSQGPWLEFLDLFKIMEEKKDPHPYRFGREDRLG